MNLYALILALIVLTLLAVSLTRLGKVKTKADYLIAGRSLPAFVLVFTLLSSWIGSGSLLGGAELAYRHGFVALWRLCRRMGRPRPHLLHRAARPPLRPIHHPRPARSPLQPDRPRPRRHRHPLHLHRHHQLPVHRRRRHPAPHLPPSVTAIQGRCLIAAFVILFTAIAGMSSVAYMDVAIGLLATFTLCLALPVLVHRFGGWSAVHAALPATHFQILGDLTSIQAGELFLPTCLLMLGNQSMYQKFFSARSERDASRAVAGWIVGTVLLETVIVALAVTGSAVFPTGEVHDHPREVLAYIGLHAFSPAQTVTTLPSDIGPATVITTTEVLPPLATNLLQLLGALLVGSIFAKIISTANNYLFSPATNLVNDIFVRYLRPNAGNRQVLLVSRAMVVLLGLWALYQGLHTESVLKKALYAYTIYAAALTPVILAAFYWRRATASAAVASIFTGTVVTVFWDSTFIHTHLPAVISERDAIFPALVASLLCLVVVSVVTPRPNLAHLRAFES